MMITSPPDVETALVTYLTGKLAQWDTGPVRVATRRPPMRNGKAPPLPMLRIQLAGGSRRDQVIFRRLIVIEAWGHDDIEAFNLAAATQDHLQAAAARQDLDGLVLYAADPIGDIHPDQDQETLTARYTATYELILKGIIHAH